MDQIIRYLKNVVGICKSVAIGVVLELHWE